MSESKATESAAEASKRMVLETQEEIGHGYCQPSDFSDAETAELQRLAAVAWFRMESRDLEQMIAEFHRRNSAPNPNNETYAELYRWCLQQTSRYPVWFGQSIPAVGVFWAYAKAALTANNVVILFRELMSAPFDCSIAMANVALGTTFTSCSPDVRFVDQRAHNRRSCI